MRLLTCLIYAHLLHCKGRSLEMWIMWNTVWNLLRCLNHVHIHTGTSISLKLHLSFLSGSGCWEEAGAAGEELGGGGELWELSAPHPPSPVGSCSSFLFPLHSIGIQMQHPHWNPLWDVGTAGTTPRVFWILHFPWLFWAFIFYFTKLGPLSQNVH